MRKPLLLIISILTTLSLFANDYEKAWEALHKNKRAEAMEYLQKAMKDPATATDAYLTYIYLKTFDGKEKESSEFYDNVFTTAKDLNPYLFALWFNEAVVGDYGKKTNSNQLKLIEKIFKRDDINGSLKSAAHYVKGMHFLYSNEYSKARDEWGQMGAIGNWQLVGPFENLSGSGFDKSFGPLEHPEKNSDFKSLTNAMIQWFTPLKMNQDGWMFLQSHIPNQTAISYAQSFVYAPSDMNVILNTGVNGSLKVWVNDALKIADPTERVTELDYYKATCQLKKGYNRILVQVGYTSNSIPNFIIRFTDDKGMAVPGLTSTTELQSYPKDATKAGLAPIRHFAEAYFEEKIKASPDNLINYILLSQTYLRNKKTFEARKLIQEALKKHADNSLLHFELIQCLLKDKNRTLLSQEIEWIKENDPECILTYKLKIENLLDEEKYDDASVLVEKMASNYGEDAGVIQDRLRIISAQEKMEEMIKLIQYAYKKYPDNFSFVEMMFNLKKVGYKDADGAIDVYEKYLKENFNYQAFKELGDEYISQGKKEKGLKLKEKLQDLFPYDADYMSGMAKYYFEQQNYSKALDYCELSLKLAPFVATYWGNKAVIQEQMGKTDDAIASYKKALYYNSKEYDSRKKLRTIEKKKELSSYFPQTDIYELIKNVSPKYTSTEHDYSYLLDEKQVILYAEGAIEEYVTLVIKIHTENGIDKWKESYIPYNEYTQSMLIEKAEIVKKNGNKVTAEKNSNDLVFTSLEAGDVIIVKYRTQNYASGRLSREFFDRYTFESFNPSEVIRYCLLAPADFVFDHKMENSTMVPEIKNVEDYKLYKWEVKAPAYRKDEPYMPSLTDIGAVLHISTVKSWNEIAKWYSDISHVNPDNDYEVKEVYAELFPGKETLTELQKAKRIYNYIEKNIRYSSVSFRQSAFVPQKAAVTLNTRLGDCKDLSSLFVTLANMAGLTANLVLVETRDNGTKEMVLPSMEFNHCIVLLKAGGKEYYLELTDNDLPFGSLPYNLPGSSILVIPSTSAAASGSEMKPLTTTTRTADAVKRVVDISPDGADLNVAVDVKKCGSLTSSVRDEYSNLSEEKAKEEMEKSVSSSFKNPVKLQSVSFSGLDVLGDTVGYKFNYNVKNEVIEVGDMKMFRVPFGDVIATIDNFTKDTREFPIEYWKYETVDNYETIVNVKIPVGKKIIEIPKDQEYRFGKNVYTIKYLLKPDGKFTITRKASLVRDNIEPKDYPAFKEFLNNIIKAESKYVAFK